MIALSWNCRGLGNAATVPTISELVRARKPDIVFLFETLSYGVRLESIRIKLKFDFCFSINCIGRSGGLAVLWNNKINCNVLNYSRNHIDMLVMDSGGDWRITGFYGFPERNRRRLSWNLLRQLSNINDLPWVVIGDFNDILSPNDKKGRVEHPQWLYRGFREAVNDSNLVDIPLLGYSYTWFRSRGSVNAVEERLDRAMANPAWHSRFPNATLHCLVAPVSDHHPIILSTENSTRISKKRSFKFENRWLWEKDFKDVVGKCWRGFSDLGLCDRLKATAETLETWGNKADSLFRTRKKELEHVIRWFQGSSSMFEIERYRKAREELGDLLIQEEVFWRQRAKIFWLKEGDINTRFFHQMCSSRKRRNKLEKLKDENGNWVEGQQGLCEVVNVYFQQLFQAPNYSQGGVNFLEAVEPAISPSQNLELTSKFQKEEFKVAINQMHGDKAPGPDGFKSLFLSKMLVDN